MFQIQEVLKPAWKIMLHVITIQREDVHSFNIARQIDPLYYKPLQEGLSKGLLVTPLKVEFKAQETWVTGEVLPFNS